MPKIMFIVGTGPAIVKDFLCTMHTPEPQRRRLLDILSDKRSYPVVLGAVGPFTLLLCPQAVNYIFDLNTEGTLDQEG